MNSPTLYLKSEKLTRAGSESIIKKYFHLFEQNGSGEKNLLDIGCGPGNITHDFLLPRFNCSIGKVVGIDISKSMIDYANATYGDQVFSFEYFDISKEVPGKFVSYFDYVVSFLALHLIKDQSGLFSNIFKSMKPNSQMLISYIAKTQLYDTYQSVWQKPEYSPYITDFNAAQTIFQHSKDPKKDLRIILENAGFEVCMISIDKIKSANSTAAALKDFLTAVNPHYQAIPDHLKEPFMLDHVRGVSGKPNLPSDDAYYEEFELFVVYAKKK